MTGPEAVVPLVLCETGGLRFGIEAARVGRIEAAAGRRSLACAGGTLPVDRVIGLVHAPVAGLRRVPAFARPMLPAAVAGFWIDGGHAVPLLSPGEAAALFAGPPAPFDPERFP